MRGLLFILVLLFHLPAWAQISVSPAAGRQADAFVGEPYGPLQIRISGGVAPYSVQGSTVALPAGMTIAFDAASSTVTIGGEPTQAGDSFRVDLRITDANNDTLQTGGYHIHAMPSRSLSFTPAAIAATAVGRPLEVIFIPQKGQSPYVFEAVGPLPPGLVLDRGGRLSGSVQQAGSFNFQVRLTDTNSSERVQDYTLQVDGLVPVVAPVSFSMAANAPATQVPLDIRGMFDSIEVVQPPGTGTAEVRGGALFYTPAAGHIGTDRLSYRARNAFGDSAPADIDIQVVGVVELPRAEDVTVSVAANSSDVPMPLAISGPQPTAVSLAGQPAHGSAQVRGTGIVYTPAAGFTGTDRFQYRAHLGAAATPAATVTMVVTDGLLVPEIIVGTIGVASGSQEQLLPITLGGGAADRLILLDPPEHGKVRIAGLSLVYSTASAFVGRDVLQIAAENGAGRSAAATLVIDVAAAGTLQYRLEMAQGGTATMSLSSAERRIIDATVLALAPAAAGRAHAAGDEVRIALSPQFHGQAELGMRLVDADGSVHDGVLMLSVTRAAPVIDPSLGVLLRAQQHQAHEVATLRAQQVAGRQSQLAGGGQGWGSWLDASVGDRRWVPRSDEHRVRGQAFGLDHSSEGRHLGVAISRAASRAPLPVAGRSKLAAHGLTAYTGWQDRGYSLDAQVGVAALDYAADRLQQGARVRSGRDGRQWQLRMRAGRSFTGSSWQAGVGFELDGQQSRLSAMGETLADGTRLQVGPQSSWAIEPALRGQVARHLQWGNVQLTPRWELALSGRWMHLDGTQVRGVDDRWQQSVLASERRRQLGWSHRLGLDLQLMPQWLLQLDYQSGGYEGGQRDSRWGLQMRMGH